MRILHVTSELDGGGIERLLFDYARRMPHDVRFDFAINADIEGILEKPLTEMGCNIFRIPRLRNGLRNYKKQLTDILKNGNYDIIHVHSAYKAFVPLFVAKKSGIKARIAHSHICNAPESRKEKAIRKISTVLTKHYATNLFACGVDAGRWVWGDAADFYVMPNAIDADKFRFDTTKREKIREELNLNGKFVIGNVARFSFQKNHEFLIKVFSSVVKSCPNAVLLLVGQGELMNDVKLQVKNLNLEESVIMLGVRNDVPDLLNAMDLFVLPSRFEGLPVTLVEVQANGLPSVAADTITREMCLASSMEFKPLIVEEWSKDLKDKYNNKDSSSENRMIRPNEIQQSKYNIVNAVSSLYKRYKQLVEVVSSI